MTLCPVALAVGCKKCPIFSICPLKEVIGDQVSAAAAPPAGPERREHEPEAKASAPGRRRKS